MASHKLGRPRDVESGETKLRLLAAARQCFGENGFVKTKNSEIANLAGITPGAIYHYFPSKVMLYTAVFKGVQDFIYAEFEKAIDSHTTLVERFSAVLDVAVRINRDDPSIAGFVVDVASEVQHNPELTAVTNLMRHRTSGFLRRLCDDAAANGELHPDVSQRSLEDLLNSLLAGLVRFSAQVKSPDRHAAAAHVLKQVLNNAVFTGTMSESQVAG